MKRKQKVVMLYVDFDDTIYLHNEHWGITDDFRYNLYFGSGVMQYKQDYINSELLSKIRQYKSFIWKNNDVKVFVFMLTCSRFNCYFENKKKLLQTYVDDAFDNYFSVSSQDEKAEFIEYYNRCFEREHEYKIVRTIVIDDSYKVLSDCKRKEYLGFTPLYFEKKLHIY